MTASVLVGSSSQIATRDARVRCPRPWTRLWQRRFNLPFLHARGSTDFCSCELSMSASSVERWSCQRRCVDFFCLERALSAGFLSPPSRPVGMAVALPRWERGSGNQASSTEHEHELSGANSPGPHASRLTRLVLWRVKMLTMRSGGSPHSICGTEITQPWVRVQMERRI